ncbi:hypothetical protein [Parasitella parasitica]|uniref:MULE transposase domain-containing protein n=1 Tax=Parasitella parasitica TaxID=35722 RepID=A0A0B7NFE2_9FUNG|nr:hypothetical protein [Parasitella parasitica]
MHASKRQLDDNQLKLISTLYKSGTTPASIRQTLSETYPGQVFDQRGIYNAIAKAKWLELKGLTSIQFLVNKLSNDGNYTFETVLNATNGQLECLFVLKNDLISIYDHRFNTSLVMDATHKTNSFELPLVQLCGIKNENKTFVLCQAFPRNGKVEKYEWFLRQMKKHCSINSLPVTTSTDKDVFLLNALRTELPEFEYLLCRWHISKSILDHIRRFFPHLEGNSVTNIPQGRNRVVSSRTEEALESNIETFIRSFPKRNSRNATNYDPSKFIAYIKTTWLDKDREKNLKSSTGELDYVFHLMGTVLKQQHTEIVVLSILSSDPKNHESTSLTKEEFHRQWWITETSQKSDDKFHKGDPFSEESIQRMKEMYNSIPPFEQVIVRNLLESIRTGQLPYSLRDPAVVQLREPKRHTKSKQDIDDCEDNEERFFGAFHNESEYGPLLPKYYYEISSKIEDSYYDAIINIDRDVFCGFRALAHQLFDNQDELIGVKFAMKDNLIDVKDACRDAFPFFNVGQLKK